MGAGEEGSRGDFAGAGEADPPARRDQRRRSSAYRTGACGVGPALRDYEQSGYDGLFDRRRGKPRPKRVPLGTVEEGRRLYPEEYADFHVRHFPEKRREAPRLERRYPWVKLARQGAGLVKKARKRGVHRKRRPRRPLPGMLLHLDGSSHWWLQEDRGYDLIVILDDAPRAVY